MSDGYLRTKVISLIEAHYKSDDFDDQAEHVAIYFDNTGDHRLADYIRAMMGTIPSFDITD